MIFKGIFRENPLMIKHFTAAKAFLKRDGKILILRESGNYKDGHNRARYDVPGGRLDPGEALLDGLTREISEECGIGFTNPTLFHRQMNRIPRGEDIWEIDQHFYGCDALDGEVTLSGDHDQYQWIDPAQYDGEPIIENLKAVFQAYLAR